MAASCTKPAKCSIVGSERTTRRRKFGSQVNQVKKCFTSHRTMDKLLIGGSWAAEPEE